MKMSQERRALTKTVTNIARESGLEWCTTFSDKRKSINNQNVVDGYRTKLWAVHSRQDTFLENLQRANHKLIDHNLKLVKHVTRYGNFGPRITCLVLNRI